MYAPVILSADRRWRYGMSPLRLVNLFAQPLPAEAGKPVKACLLPTPGKTVRLDLGVPIQGLYREAGVRNGDLYAVAGGTLYHISRTWTATAIGAIGGTGDAVFAGLRDALYVARGGKPWKYDGATLTQVADIDAPNVATMIVLAQRIVAGEDGSDTLFWSATLDGTAWEALGFETGEQRPDPTRKLERVAGQIAVMGEASIEIHRATGDSQLPFANITAQSIDETEGLLGRDASTVRGDKLYFIGGNLRAYLMAGFSVQELPTCGELEDVLKALGDNSRQMVQCWSYSRGTNEYFVVRPPGSPAFVFDASTRLWHNRQTWGQATWLPRYYANAYSCDVVAEEGGTEICTLDEQVYTDAGDVIERVATTKVSSKTHETVGCLTVDVRTVGRPAAGAGSDPVLMVEISSDGISDRDDSRSEETLALGADGKYAKPVMWSAFEVHPGEGSTMTFRLTDPVGMSLYGAWLNEGEVSG